MFKLLVDSHIPYIDEYFSRYFDISYYQDIAELHQNIQGHDILISRATTPIHENLITGSQLKVVATASSGYDHVDHQALKKRHIEFFSGHGANANAVCDYVTSTLAYLLHHKILSNPKIAIIGYGAVGKKVYNRLHQLEFELGVYDPFINDIPNEITIHDLSTFDVICLHPSYHQINPFPSHQMIDLKFLESLNSNTCIINAARGKIVDEEAILNPSFKGIYCTDVYWNEPHINPKIIERALLCTPHIAGHTIEGKRNITKIISEKIHQYFNLIPQATKNFEIQSHPTPLSKWQTEALTLYNPENESQSLKAYFSAQEFLRLRRAHTFRHDFPWH